MLFSWTNIRAQEEDAAYLHTGLPVCYVNYPQDSILTKENSLDAFIEIHSPETNFQHKVKISGRGNSTWKMAKKPYNLKFEDKVSLLGMRAGKKYALMANHFDPSLSRIAIGFAMGEWVDFEWTLQGRYVELVLNGKHKGCYFLAERVSRNTVPVDKDAGYVLEYRYKNQLTEKSVNFLTDINSFIMEFKIPDDPLVGGTMYNHAVQTINRFEEAIFAEDNHTARRFEDLIDEDNFVRWYYWKNVLQMDECNRFYVMEDMDRQTSLKMGPIWDFDWTLGMNMYRQHYSEKYMRNKLFFYPLWDDSVFLGKVANFHVQYRDRIEQHIHLLYDSLYTLLQKPFELNAKVWEKDRLDTIDLKKEMNIDKNYLLETLDYLDNELTPYLVPTALQAPVDDASPKPARKIMHQGRLYILKGNKLYDIYGRPRRHW